MMSGVTGDRRKISSPSASSDRVHDRAVGRADRRLADAADAGRRLRIRKFDRVARCSSAARRESSAACCGGTAAPAPRRTAGRRPTAALSAWPRPSIEPPNSWPLQAARVEDRADVADRGVVDHVVRRRFRCRLRLPRSRRRRTAIWPSRGYASLATAISPWPASAFADVFVKALMSSGSSWPSNLPPSSIAFCAACANVMPPPGPETLAAGDLVRLRVAAVRLRGDLLQLLDRVGRRRVRRARHRVRRLAAGRDAGPRQVLRRVAEDDVALLPRHAEHFGGLRGARRTPNACRGCRCPTGTGCGRPA